MTALKAQHEIEMAKAQEEADKQVKANASLTVQLSLVSRIRRHPGSDAAQLGLRQDHQGSWR
jgi:hypothetical protein